MMNPEEEAATILVVDDEELVRYTLVDILEGAGYKVVTAAGGEVALNRLRDDKTQSIGLLITDFNMPGMSGLDLAGHLQRLRPDIAVLFQSANMSEETAAGFGGVLLTKPFPPAALLKAVEALLRPSIG